MSFPNHMVSSQSSSRALNKTEIRVALSFKEGVYVGSWIIPLVLVLKSGGSILQSCPSSLLLGGPLLHGAGL